MKKELPKFLERKIGRRKFAEICIKKHDARTLREIVVKYPDLLEEDEDNGNLLIYAAECGFDAGIKFLLGKMSPEQIKKVRREMLEGAIVYNHPETLRETLRFLIRRIGLEKKDYSSLIKACFQENPSRSEQSDHRRRRFLCRREMLEILFENGVDVHTQNDLALKLACRRGCVDAVKWLLEEKGANVNAKREGKIYLEPILEAVRIFHDPFKLDTESASFSKEAVQIVKMLLEHKANPFVFCPLNILCGSLNPLGDMVEYGDIEVVQRLLESEASDFLNGTEKIEEILIRAARNSLEMFEFLMKFLMKTITDTDVVLLALKAAIKAGNVGAVIYSLKQNRLVFSALDNYYIKEFEHDILYRNMENNKEEFPEIIDEILKILPDLAQHLSRREVDRVLKNLIEMEKIDLAEKFYEPIFIKKKRMLELAEKESELELKIQKLKQERNKIVQEIQGLESHVV